MGRDKPKSRNKQTDHPAISPPLQGDPVAKIVGFPQFTMKKDVEDGMDNLLGEWKAEYKDRGLGLGGGVTMDW